MQKKGAEGDGFTLFMLKKGKICPFFLCVWGKNSPSENSLLS